MRFLCGQSNRVWHWAAGRWPGSVGLLLGPNYYRRIPIDDWMPFALDNDAFAAWVHKKPWSFDAWFSMLERMRLLAPRKPEWVLIPDVVADRKSTLENWRRYAPLVRDYNWQLAMAVQDQMTPDDLDIEPRPDLCFVGGTDGWKFPNLPMWTKHFKRVHCARVNSPQMFERCEELGCESIDGTGWFRDPSRKDKLPAILRFLEGHRNGTPQLFSADSLLTF